jgi:hypothetical protein
MARSLHRRFENRSRLLLMDIMAKGTKRKDLREKTPSSEKSIIRAKCRGKSTLDLLFLSLPLQFIWINIPRDELNYIL